MNKPQVLIVIGSESDIPVMSEARTLLGKFGISCDITIASAHRSPDRVLRLVKEAEGKGIEVIIAGAGSAAHLAGVIASHTILPVIGVPLDSSPLKGIDAILSTLQMPAGVPVAAMAVGAAGAKNSAVFAAQILARKNPEIAEKLKEYKAGLARDVESKALKYSKGS